MANVRMAHDDAVSRTAMNDSWMTSADVRAAPKMMTAAVRRASYVNAANMASVSSARVPAGMSASTVPASMSSAMLGENWIRRESADAHAQQDGEPDCESLFPAARSHPGRYAGLRLHK
jgi:hypothetical protein